MKLLQILLNQLPLFANEAAPTESTSWFASEFANEIKAEGNWVQLAPFGDWDNAQGMQRFERGDAEAIVRDFNSFANIAGRAIGLPWYIGHPDHPRFKDRYLDTKAYGRIKALEVRDQGLFANVKWSDAGKQLIQSESFHGHSVNWRMRKDGAVFRPVSLKSVGFTNEPQIQVEPITHANEKQTNMKEIAKSLGLPETATEAEIITKITALLKAAETAKTDQATMANERKATASMLLDNAIASGRIKATERATWETEFSNEFTGTLTKLKTPVATSQPTTEFANERKARVGMLIAEGLRVGKILKADQARWEAEFANEFDATLAKLEQAPARLNTSTILSGIGQRNSGVASDTAKQAQIQEFVNERMAKTNEDYHTAYCAIKATKPDLFPAQ